jgi:SNF2 family DNA or RNA helicase
MAAVTYASPRYTEMREQHLAPPPNSLAAVANLERHLRRPLLHHQREFCALSYPRMMAYNASEQGTGKTTTALFMAKLWRANRVLVVCPKSVMTEWANEHDEVFLDGAGYQVHCLDSGPVEVRKAQVDGIPVSGRHLLLINYEVVATMLRSLTRFHADVVIADEAWRLKSDKAKVTQAAFDLSRLGGRTLLMSGTPIGNDVGDYYPQLLILGLHLPWQSRESFLASFAELIPRRTAQGHSYLKPVGCTNPHGLMTLLDQVGWYRASKATCLDLPPKRFRRVSCPMLPEQERAYHAIEEEGDSLITPLSLNGTRVNLIRLQQVVGGFLPPPDVLEDEERPAVTELPCGKLTFLHQWTRDHLVGDTTRRCIIWCKFNAEVARITSELGGIIEGGTVVGVTGATTNDQLDAIKASFNSRDPEGVVVIVAQIKKLAYGHNLQSADYNIYYSHTWSYIEYAQSQDRAHRYGRHDPVEYLVLESPRTVDQRVLQALDRKEDLAVQLAPDTVTPG